MSDAWGGKLLCDFRRCKAYADYGNMDCVDDQGEEFGTNLCKIHAIAILRANDDMDQYDYDNLDSKQKLRVRQIAYRIKHPRKV